MLVCGNHHLCRPAHRVRRQVQSEVPREARLHAAVSQRLDEHVDERRTASRQGDASYASRGTSRGTVHVVLRDLQHLAQVAEHFLQKNVGVLIRVGTERVAANALQHAARSVREKTHDAAAGGVDLRVTTIHDRNLVANLFYGDAAGDRNEELRGSKRVNAAQRLF